VADYNNIVSRVAAAAAITWLCRQAFHRRVSADTSFIPRPEIPIRTARPNRAQE